MARSAWSGDRSEQEVDPGTRSRRTRARRASRAPRLSLPRPLRRFLATTGRMAEQTPADRNRVVDAWRVVAILTVVVGHWLAASIWLRPDGELTLLNSLEWIPYAGWVTWVVQVMPIFFLVGGFANGRALERVASGRQPRGEWVAARIRRLFAPVVPLLVVWVLLVVVLRDVVPGGVLHAGAMAATVPLWFLAVYLTLTALAPFTHRWWSRAGLASVAAPAAAAIAVDAVRFPLDLPVVGYVNFLFVWAAVHQLGYWWADRDADGVSPRTGLAVAGVALGILVAVTWTGVYPVAMLGIPGAEATNMTPPTFAMVLLGAVQAGVIWATQGPVRRLAGRPRVWHGVVAVSAVMMSIYLWHLSALGLLTATGLWAFDGLALALEPGTTAWWASRPVWVAALALVTAGLVAVFARFEWRVPSGPAPRPALLVVGVLLTAGSAGAVADLGIATRQAEINWSIPAAALLGAALVGALPLPQWRNQATR